MRSPTARIRTIDLPVDVSLHASRIPTGSRFQGTPEAERIEQIFMDTAQFDHGDLKRAVDFVFVDAGAFDAKQKADAISLRATMRVRGSLLPARFVHLPR